MLRRRLHLWLLVVAILAIALPVRADENDLWSLQPIRNPQLPSLKPRDRQVAQTPIDHFILARLSKAGLHLSKPASRRTLIRRLTIDLTGLLPTPKEVDDFIVDTSPLAYERVVDRLLASPRYGERWGRHWLDVVRYAESNGFERNKLRNNFWRYRDYIINAFNCDKSYAQFVREQLAGDALKPEKSEYLIATGFLVAGPKNDVKTDSKLQRMKRRQDEIDEFVRVTSTSLLGLTVGCGRCHDHMFDPITSRDYYGMAAVFSGLDRQDKVVVPSSERKQRAARVAAAKSEVEFIRTELAEILKPVRARLIAARLKALTKRNTKPKVAYERNEESFKPVFATHVRMVIQETSGNAMPGIDELEVFGADPKRNLALASNGATASASSVVANNDFHKVHHLNDGRYGNARSWISKEQGRGAATIALASRTKVQLVVWGRDRTGVYKDRLPIRYLIQIADHTVSKSWRTVSNSESRVPFNGELARRKATAKISEKEIVLALTAEERSQHKSLQAALLIAQAKLKSLPQLTTSYIAHDNKPQPTFVLARGDVRSRREKVGPRALAAVKSLNPSLLPKGQDSGPARRMRLAEWMVDSKNPLLSRVFVNRVWQYHFGSGIVTTPNDFGTNGDRPSHPKLLDWLAADFMQHGWSPKRLHRTIVLSAVYRQRSHANAQAAAIDAANRLLWRTTPRRLEAEAIRDTILQVSGQLNMTLGGPSFRLFRYIDGNVPEYVLLKKPGRESWRRAIYMFNIHTFDSPLMRAFDCADATIQVPTRGHSVTALQALSLMNNRFVFEQADLFAKRVSRAAGKQPEQPVVKAYQIALLRTPNKKELEAATEFVNKHGLFSLCRVLLNTNEFLYVY